MFGLSLLELFGYLGSVVIAISLMMSSIVKLRIINLTGALIFTIYGTLISAYPVAVLNGFIVIVNIYYLYEMFTKKEFFEILEVNNDSNYLNYFINFHKKDILLFNPKFDISEINDWVTFFILSNSVAAGLVLYNKIDDDSLFVKLDYAIPGYRDFKIGKYVYNEIKKDKSVKNIYTAPGNAIHNAYLKKIGFIESELNSDKVMYIKND